MHRNRRDALSIIADILSIINAKGPIKKTRLMNYANLNPRTFKNYMQQLMEEGLVGVDSKDMFYLTDKGLQYLTYYRALLTVISSSGNRNYRMKLQLSEVLTEFLSRNTSVRVGYSFISSYGTRFFYDALIVGNGEPKVAILYLDPTLSTAVRNYRVGMMLLSCYENSGLQHIVLGDYDVETYYKQVITRHSLALPCRMEFININGSHATAILREKLDEI